MNYSGILVITTQDQLDPLRNSLNALDGVEVHHVDEETSRLIVVQEAGSINDEVNGLKRIKALPGVVLAEMVTHYFGEAGSEALADAMPEDIDAEAGFDNRAMRYLNNA